MEITICIGSSCHLKGARDIVAKLEKIIEEKRIYGVTQSSSKSEGGLGDFI